MAEPNVDRLYPTSKGTVYGFEIDASGLGRLAKDLYSIAAELNVTMHETLDPIGRDLTEKMRAEAAKHSSSVAGSIEGQSEWEGYRITAGNGVPLAGLYEFGNRGGRNKNEPEFQHPVFGRYPPVWQWRYPFMKPVWRRERRRVYEALNEAWALLMRKHGIPTERLP